MNPEGLVYEPEFITAAEEASLLAAMQALPLVAARHREYTAKRRIVTFEAPPDFLVALRDRVAAWLSVPAGELAHTLINEYRPGTALGWHRDSPEYEFVAGVSLGTTCRMRFRPWPPAKGRNRDTLELQVEPRSAYAMRGTVRWGWQHSVPAVKALRYSITFRTLRAQGLHRARHGAVQAYR
jgi:alkylated DNA repair dioxygenase AlkB